MSFEKYERDGKVAVLVSPGFGAGWSSWVGGDEQQAAMDRRLVERVLTGGKIDEELAVEVLGGDPYLGDINVDVEWVEKGKPFYIHVYDGSEHLVTDFWIA